MNLITSCSASVVLDSQLNYDDDVWEGRYAVAGSVSYSLDVDISHYLLEREEQDVFWQNYKRTP